MSRSRSAEVAGKQRQKAKGKPRGRPFPKGTSGNAGGRPAGYGAFREMCRDYSPQALEALGKAMKGGGAAAVAAARFIIETAWGRAPASPGESQPQSAGPSVLDELTRDELVALASMPDACSRCEALGVSASVP